MTRMLTYTVYLDAEEYENGTVKLDDVSGFIESDFQDVGEY